MHPQASVCGNLMWQVRRPLPIVAAVVIASLASSCTVPQALPLAATAPTETRPPRPLTLTIAHTNDVSGYLEPCG